MSCGGTENTENITLASRGRNSAHSHPRLAVELGGGWFEGASSVSQSVNPSVVA